MTSDRPLSHVLRRLASVAFVVVLAVHALADVVHLKDGRRVEGVVIEETSTVVKVKTRLAVLEFKPSEVDRIVRKKTKQQEFDERWEAAKTADELFELGKWAEEKHLRKEARRAMNKAVELDPKHRGANTWLGFVEYEGEWMTPEERDARLAADHEAKMRERGLVRYGDRWVTPAEREKLEAGLVLHEGKWIPFADAQRALGLEEFEGSWIPRTEAFARTHAAEASVRAGVPFAVHLNEQALVAGAAAPELLAEIGDGILVGRKWFDELMKAEPGLLLIGDRLAELYVFAGDSEPYVATVEYFGSLTPTVPDGWAPVAAKSHGFFWIDPYTLSSARKWHRDLDGLRGHCFHHWGHMLLGRLDYDGRLLPPWYEEAFASLAEFAIHERNAVFCRARSVKSSGTSAKGRGLEYDLKRVREGNWRNALKEALGEKAVPSFDKLAGRDFSELEVLDIAAGMGILEWIASHGELAPRTFHREVRKHAPEVPLRIVPLVHDRLAAYDAAFQAATGVGWREADHAWREWFLGR